MCTMTSHHLRNTTGDDIGSDRIVLAHSPLREVAADESKRALLVSDNAEVARRIAKSYGWTNYITIQEYAARNPVLYNIKT